jgi:WD40 repeat protein
VSPLTQELKTTRPAKRSFQWPTVESTHRVRIKGDGDVSIQGIAFSSDGSQFAVNCNDRTVRIWNNRNHTEIARLAHNSSILAVAWMQGDAGIVSLADDGVVSKWTRTGQNHWQWAKILDAGIERGHDEETVCFAYKRDRIAVAFPRVGVKVWLWLKGMHS